MHYLDSSGGGEPSLDCFITIPGIRAGMEPGRLRILRGRDAFRLAAGDALAVAVSRINTAAFRRAATIYAGPCGLSDPAVDDGDSIAKRASMPVAIDALTAPAVFDGARFGLAAWAMPSKFHSR